MPDFLSLGASSDALLSPGPTAAATAAPSAPVPQHRSTTTAPGRDRAIARSTSSSLRCRGTNTPGATATPASVSSRLANSIDPRSRNGSGIGAQANIDACGGGMSQPARPKHSTSTSRRLR